MPAHVCYESDALTSFLRGELAEEDSAEVLVALASCEECARRMEDVESQSDSLIDALRNDDPDRDFLDEPEFQDVARKLQAAVLKETDSAAGPTATAHRGQHIEDRQPSESVRIRDYELLNKLGQGGMGAVYRARHVRLKREVAVKVMTTPRLHDPQALARFEREMEAIGRLDHPNIVRATDAGNFNGLHYLVMEYVAGCDVSMLAMLAKPLPVDDACEIVRQAAIGLQHAFENGQVHRDMKPSNLILTEDGTVKILDMGLALVAGAVSDAERTSELTGSGQILGTIDYMAPEQAHDTHTVDVRADIYSLGATLYRLLAGQSPFSSHVTKSTLQRLQTLTTEDPPPITEMRENLPDGLVGLLERMLSRNPDDRPQQPADVAHALDEFTADADLLALLARTAADRAALRASCGTGISELPFSSASAESLLVSTDSLLTADARTADVRASNADQSTTKSHSELTGTSLHPSVARRSAAIAVVCLLAAGALFAWRPWETDHSEARPVNLGDAGDPAKPVVQSTNAATRTGTIGVTANTTGLPSDPDRPAVSSPQISEDVVRLASDWFVEDLEFTPDGHLVSTGWDMSVWDVEQAAQIAFFKHPLNFRDKQGGGVNRCAVSPDGTRLATAAWRRVDQVCIDIFELPGHELLRTFGESEPDRHTNIIASIDFSPDGSQLITASWDGTVRLWDAETGEHRGTFQVPDTPNQFKFTFVRFIGVGAQIFAASSIGARPSLHVWDVELSSRRDVMLPRESFITDVSRDGRRAVCVTYHRNEDRREINVIDVESGQIAPSSRPVDGPLRGMKLSPGGRHALIMDDSGQIEFWNLDADRSLRVFEGVSVLGGDPKAKSAVAISLDGRLGAAAGIGGLIVFRLPTDDAAVDQPPLDRTREP